MKQSILVEIILSENENAEKVFQLAQELRCDGFVLDPDYEPVFMSGDSSKGSAVTAIVHGWVNAESVIEELNKLEEVSNVWEDSHIAPMSSPD